jgi:predicted nuclease of predicted toxin-antitoxin system
VKFKLDENLPTELIADLSEWGHDADTVMDEGLRGAPDPAVVQAAHRADRVLLALDKGIANLQRYPMAQQAGVVLFRPDTRDGVQSWRLFGSIFRKFLNWTCTEG